MKHISIRIPWHDNGWKVHTCLNPCSNTYCQQLPKIVESKFDCKSLESDTDWSILPSGKRPPCSGENGGFMNDKEYDRVFTHLYSWNKNNPHHVLRPTHVRIPPYSALGIPFRYLNIDAQDMLSEQHPEFRPAERAPFYSSWVYNSERLYDILNWFSNEVVENESMCVFYCKKGNPIDDEGVRMIVGMGDVKRVYGVKDYDSSAEYTYPLWEIMFSHSIRSDLRKSEGFLLPYQEYLDLAEEDFEKHGLTKEKALDAIKLSLDKFDSRQKIFDELSYGCDFISNHSMLIILEASRRALEAVLAHKLVGKEDDWKRQLRWIDSRIIKVKKQISPFPSFAAALMAIGIDYANLIESDIRRNWCAPKDNPWNFFKKLINKEIAVKDAVYNQDLDLYRDTWNGYDTDIQQRLEFLSRFDLESDIIEHYIKNLDDAVTENPYIISEWCAINEDFRVSTRTIDLGTMPDTSIQGDNVPVEPYAVHSPIDLRRLRSFLVEKLCAVLNDGDTLLSLNEAKEYLRDYLHDEDGVSLPDNILITRRAFFEPVIDYIEEGTPKAVQLKNYHKMEDDVRKTLLGRAKRKVRKPTGEDWLKIAQSDPNYDASNPRSRQATEQQAQALEMMDKKRLSVLTGGAGTGKTTVVRSFLKSETIRKEGVLLLAPTGKARVRLSTMAEGITSKTVAQFLTSLNAFDFEGMKPRITSDSRTYSGAKNIIIDECSMLTIDMLNALLKSLDPTMVNRIIMIGDPYQLPPIGAGRPFSDLCHYLQGDNSPDDVKDAITYLRTVVRTITKGESDVLTLASWFSGNKPEKSADEVFEKMTSDNLKGDLAVYTWNSEEELAVILKSSLCNELNCTEDELVDSLKSRLGIDNLENLSSNPEILESLQVLTPVLNPVWGTYRLNGYIQRWIGNSQESDTLMLGSQKICKSDKIIQLQNMKRESYPTKEKCHLANGQIGFVKSIINKHINVTYAGLPDKQFGFRATPGEDTDAAIELAYAITIHKSQGSDFDTVIVVLPKTGKILSRELIYTALTRAKKRVILLIQDQISWIREFTKPQASVLARRNSNLFSLSIRDNHISVPYVEGLIHGTAKDGLFVRSKSEVIIVNQLVNAGINFDYEKLLEEDDHRCIPDFSFSTPYGDRIIWEHLGMLGIPEYKASWERKLKFYESIGYTLGENLFTTQDHENGAIMTAEINTVINRIKELFE